MYVMYSLILRFNVFCNNIDFIYLKFLSVFINFCEIIVSIYIVIMVKSSNVEIENLLK